VTLVTVHHGTSARWAESIQRYGLLTLDPTGVTVTVDRAVAKAYAKMRTAALMVECGGPPEGLIVSATIDERRLGRWECCGFGDRTACSNKECLIHDSG
jgi:hypothetical protein